MAAEIQQSVIDVLIQKTVKAAKNHKVKTTILGGGVTANQELRKQFLEKTKQEMPKIKLLMPSPQLSTDNAVMVGITAYYQWLNPPAGGKNWKEIKANANLRIDETYEG